MKIMVSACLLGENCKYNGGNNLNKVLLRKLSGHEIIPVCPEVEGGLPVPRVPAEIVNGKVMNREGADVDAAFRLGAKKALDTAIQVKPDLIILQSRSPSCGVKEIYDGSFTGKKIPGQGVFARMAVDAGFKVTDIEDLRLTGSKDPGIKANSEHRGETKMIREAAVNDSARIAEIDVISSRYAYKGILSDECLYQDLTVENRIPVYKRWITEKRFDIYVYEDPGTEIVKGMMGIGLSEDEDKKDAFELHFLYVDPDSLRAGIGSEMLQFFEQKGKDQGNTEYVVWVLEENGIGRNFYEKNNYVRDGKEKIFKRWNKREIRYVKGI